MKNIICNETSYTPSKIICVGKNFPSHITEMGNEGRPAKPIIFIKPNSAIAFNPSELLIPQDLGLLHHEVELCCVVGKEGIEGYCVGLDLTLRDLQNEAKSEGLPWVLAKCFDRSAVFGMFASANEIKDPYSLNISLHVNGKLRQKANTKEMIFSPTEIITYTAHYMSIEEGDIFMCGTPSGVGELKDGDEVVAEIEGIPRLEMVITRM